MKAHWLAIAVATLAALLVATTPACGPFCWDDEEWCEDDWQDDCWDEDCWDDDWDNDTDDEWNEWGNGGYCQTDSDCPQAEVCHPDDFCVDVVTDCPLTDECLGDPEGYTPEWMGIDPLFVGSFQGDGAIGRVELLVDFYEDHLYGEAQLVIERQDDYYWDWMTVVVTGTRDGALLWGQIVDANAWERTFDATFEAELLSSSEIVGSVFVSSDEGSAVLDFHLFRTSPCGCDPDAPPPDCSQDADCPEGQICQDGDCQDGPPDGSCDSHSDCQTGQACVEGSCTELCQADSDCQGGEVCQDSVCVEGCATECCATSDCDLGYECVEGACLNPCVHWCDCAEGEDCIDGYCQQP